MAQYPAQKVSKSEKDEAWGKRNVDYHIELSSFSQHWYSELRELYEIYAYGPEESTYNYVKNPYNSPTSGSRSFPARLRNYNIIKPIVDLLVGEIGKRPKEYQVLCGNNDVATKFLSAQQNFVKAYMQKMFKLQMAQEQGIDIGIDPGEIKPFPEAFKEFKDSYNDSRAVLGQKALTGAKRQVDIEDKIQDMAFDYIVTGECYSFKSVQGSEIVYEPISPLDIDYDKSYRNKYVEDGNWVVVRKVMQINEAVDFFADFADWEDDYIDVLEDEGSEGSIFFSPVRSNNQEEAELDRKVEVFHVVWRSFEKRGRLSYMNDIGETEVVEVPEGYKLDKEIGDLEIDWFWQPIIMEGYRIGKSLYIGIDKRQDRDNKLPYNGRKYHDRHVNSFSIVRAGLPYQILYDIFHYRLELTMAKNKDKIMLMEINAIPEKPGWDEDKFMYFMDAMGVAFVDTNGREGKNIRHFNQYQSIDMSLSQYLAKTFEILGALKAEFEESVGINRQRKGQVSSSDGLGVTEQAKFQSAIISDEMFRRFEHFLEKEFLGLLDLTKAAWADGHEMMYMKGIFDQEFYMVDPEELANSSWMVVMKNSGKEQEKLYNLKANAQAFAQNLGKGGITAHMIAEIIDADSFAEIKQLMKEQTELADQMEQQAMAQKQQEIQAFAENSERQRMHESMENEKKRIHEKELQILKDTGKLQQLDANNDRIPDSYQLAKNLLEGEKAMQQAMKNRDANDTENKKIKLEERKMKSDEKIRMEELQVRREEMKNDLKIAKENRNKYDR